MVLVAFRIYHGRKGCSPNGRYVFFFLRLQFKPMYCLIKTVRKTADLETTRTYLRMYVRKVGTLRILIGLGLFD